MFKNNNYTISSELKYKPDVARLCTIHSPTLAPGTHDVSYYLPSEVLVLGACDVIQPDV